MSKAGLVVVTALSVTSLSLLLEVWRALLTLAVGVILWELSRHRRGDD